MISITTKSPYAVQALCELGRCGGERPVPIAELARRREIPVQFLEQLFAVLRRAGILQVPARASRAATRSPASRRRSRCSRSSSCSTGRSAPTPRASSPRPPDRRPRRPRRRDDRRPRRARDARGRRVDVLHLARRPVIGVVACVLRSARESARQSSMESARVMACLCRGAGRPGRNGGRRKGPLGGGSRGRIAAWLAARRRGLLTDRALWHIKSATESRGTG